VRKAAKPDEAEGRGLDHHKFDLAIFRRSLGKRGARHLFDKQPMGEQVFLRLYLGWEFCLENAALPRISVRYFKGYDLQSLVDLLRARLGKFPHRLFLLGK
jgi:hypothetical protein